MQKLKFDPTINISNMVAVAALMLSVLAFWVKIETTFATYEAKFQQMERGLNEVKEELLWLRRNHNFQPRETFPRHWPGHPELDGTEFRAQSAGESVPCPRESRTLEADPLQPSRVEIKKQKTITPSGYL